MEDALDLITEHIDEFGPFDGVLGFSQGCHLATAVIVNAGRAARGHPFRFGVFLGAAPSFHSADKERCQSQTLDIPIMHVIGLRDEYRLQSRAIAAMHSNSADCVTLEHDGGHQVPTDALVKSAIVRYIQNGHSQSLAAA
jgi:predicted esterase